MDIKEMEDVFVAGVYSHARKRLGNAVGSYWIHESQSCPGCRRPIENGKEGDTQRVSFNTFLYRECGVLIGYRLCCMRCASRIMRTGQRQPGVRTPWHGRIEQNLIRAYRKHVSARDA